LFIIFRHLKALQTEAERLRLVCQHPSILNLHGIITEKDNYSLVLEYMPLGSATDFRKDFTVQWPLIIQILRDVIDGMTFLHGHDPTILHLDLKADNILLDKGLRAKVSLI
jgi:serine/threonine protein kinase